MLCLRGVRQRIVLCYLVSTLPLCPFCSHDESILSCDVILASLFCVPLVSLPLADNDGTENVITGCTQPSSVASIYQAWHAAATQRKMYMLP